MNIAAARKFLDEKGIVYDLDDVAAGSHTSGQTSKFWPYRLAGTLIYGETAGIKKLPGRVLLAPMPVLGKLCPVNRDLIRGYLETARDLGFFDHLEFYSNHALAVVAQSPWELGLLDFPPSDAGGGLPDRRELIIPPTHPYNPPLPDGVASREIRR